MAQKAQFPWHIKMNLRRYEELTSWEKLDREFNLRAYVHAVIHEEGLQKSKHMYMTLLYSGNFT
jgi:hypothetical protein